jgi:hypothetical protein
LYPKILSYQSGQQVATIMNKEYAATPLNVYDISPHTAHFYLKASITQIVDLPAFTQLNNVYLYTTQNTLSRLTALNTNYKILYEFNDFQTTKLNVKFLDKNKRAAILTKHYLIAINPRY